MALQRVRAAPGRPRGLRESPVVRNGLREFALYFSNFAV